MVGKVEREKVWQSTLISCALVCKGWHSRSRYHLDRAIYLSSREQVRRLSTRVRFVRNAYPASSFILRNPSSHIVIRGEASAGSAPAPHLGTFAAMLARQLPGATQLTLSSVYWRPTMVQPRCLNLLAVFRGITRLALVSTRVQTLSLLGSLLAAMPCIRTLSCADVRCGQDATPAGQPAARCACGALRELALAWTERSVMEFLGDVAIVAPPVELLTVRLYARSIVKGDLVACTKLFAVYASSLTELRLFADGEAGDGGSVGELPRTLNPYWFALTRPRVHSAPPTSLPQQALPSLKRITLGHLFQSRGNDFSWIPSLLSSITSEALSHIHIVLKPTVILAKAGGTSCADRVKGIEDSGGLRLLDKAFSLEQSVDKPRRQMIIEIRTLSVWHAAMNKALEQRGGWERLVKDQMPRTNSRGILHCVE